MAEDRKQSTFTAGSPSPTTQDFPQAVAATRQSDKEANNKEDTHDSIGPASPRSPTNLVASQVHKDRRDSDEWDASKVPPSRFQKRKGSIYAVPPSRDGRIDSNYQSKYFEKLHEKGYDKK
ncbi:hypothetical protein B0J18DRAFT_462348 [Chaetomium sp. MPI-SDFR-AT-0129]|nr:hypothetical protein B0J18DRAFT_462348 [Chaetomium sp. MPI-SDFR-AT-0129]